MIIVAAAGASAEPWSPPEGTTNTEAEAGEQIHERRVSLKEQKRRQSSYVARVRENRENSRR